MKTKMDPRRARNVLSQVGNPPGQNPSRNQRRDARRARWVPPWRPGYSDYRGRRKRGAIRG